MPYRISWYCASLSGSLLLPGIWPGGAWLVLPSPAPVPPCALTPAPYSAPPPSGQLSLLTLSVLGSAVLAQQPRLSSIGSAASTQQYWLSSLGSAVSAQQSRLLSCCASDVIVGPVLRGTGCKAPVLQAVTRTTGKIPLLPDLKDKSPGLGGGRVKYLCQKSDNFFFFGTTQHPNIITTSGLMIGNGAAIQPNPVCIRNCKSPLRRHL